ncbi:hypothetical protein HYPP_04442 [Hyphomicrobium sp. ghe19]|nr:hypothetical protein HYPP_04442 [Hyphomicrobium sp. ghe19]
MFSDFLYRPPAPEAIMAQRPVHAADSDAAQWRQVVGHVTLPYYGVDRQRWSQQVWPTSNRGCRTAKASCLVAAELRRHISSQAIK